MNFTDLITIAIPCFERKEYFFDALESALNQTVKCKVIVVDNCSSHDYFKKTCLDKKVTYFRNDSNIGLFPNINRCYSLAKTEYVKFLQSDDILSPKYVESFVNTLRQYPDIDVFYTDYLILSSKVTSNHNDILPFGYMEMGNKIIEYAAKYNLGFPYLTTAIRKSIAQIDLDKNMIVGGYDWEWIYTNADRLTFYGESGKLYQYRMHGNKCSRGGDWSAYLLTHPYVLETIISKKIFDSKLKKKVFRKIYWGMVNVKAQGNRKVLFGIMDSDNRFGNYLKAKLNNEYKFKIIFSLPKSIVKLAFLIRRIIRKIHSLALKLK